MKIKISFLGLLTLALGLLAQPSQAQECGSNELTKVDTSKCKEQLSVFHSYVKQKNYDDGLGAWRYYYCNCPKDDNSQKWVYIDGAKIMIDLIKKNKKTPELRDAYYDTLMNVYDYWIKYYDSKKPSDVLSYKGLYTYAYQNHKVERLKEAQGYFEESIKLAPDDVSYSTVTYYLSTLQKLTKYNEVDTTYWIDQYFLMSDIVDAGIAKKDKYKAKWEKTREDIDKMMEPVLQCSQLVPIYNKKLEGEVTIDELKKMVVLLGKKGCDDSDAYEKAATRLCEREPSAVCKFALGKMMYQKGKYAEALQYMKEAVELEEDPERKSTYYISMADCYLKMGNSSGAMSAANSALSHNPNNGVAYILKAGIYAGMMKNCKEFDKKAGYWVVVDNYIKAKSVDPSQAERANASIAKYSQYFPEKGEIFFQTDENGNTLAIGGSYTVKCLGATTTIRAKAAE